MTILVFPDWTAMVLMVVVGILPWSSMATNNSGLEAAIEASCCPVHPVTAGARLKPLGWFP